MDITFRAGDGKFNLRVGALIRNGGRILMATSPLERDDVYYSVGGRVKHGESFEQAVRREVREETGIDCEPVRMIAVHENFFVNVEGFQYHEVSVYFLFEDERLNDIPSGHLTEDGPDGEKLFWINADDEELTVFPSFFRDASPRESEEIKHYVTHDIFPGSGTSDCGLSDGSKWFRYRAAAMIEEDGCVLFAHNEIDDYYYSVGGAVHFGETAENAVKREVLEETGREYETEYLAVIHENFFNESSGSLLGKECHEVSMYFMMKPRGTKKLNSRSRTMGVRETMHWIPVSELDSYKAFPTFMKDYLMSEHKGIVHIVTDERA